MKERLAGAWRLTDYRAERADGDVLYPLGRGAQGFILYTHDGHMSATLASANRQKFASSDLMAGTADERAAAAASFFSYAATYEVDEVQNEVKHHIKVCSVPNWVGAEQRRLVILDGNKLELRAPGESLVGGEMRRIRVFWERPK